MMNTVTELSYVTVRSEDSWLEKIFQAPHNSTMPDWGFTGTAVILFLIGFFGFFLNLFVIILMCKDNQIWTPMNIILLNLVCSDFAVSIIGNPFTLASSLNHGWMFGESVCVAYGFFMSLLGITSITTLTVLAYERYCLVSCPFSTSHLTKTGAKICVVFIWVYSLIITTPPLFGWGQYVSEAANISCSVNWESQTRNATTYIVFLFTFGLFVPVNVILFSYTKIIKTMRENNLRSGRVNKVENRVTSMIFVMIIAFMIAWTPYAIFALCEQFGDPNLISPTVAVLPALIAKSSICYNPLIYVGMNSQFRAALERVRGNANNPSNANDTTVNQISEASSKVYIECSFTSFEKKKKSQIKGNSELQGFSRQIKTLNESTKHSSFNNKHNNVSIPHRKSQAFLSSSLDKDMTKFPEHKAFLFSKTIKRKENNYELRMFSSEANIYGKAFNQIIRANSHKSNFC